MPHCVILYTPNIEAKTDISRLCRALADAMITSPPKIPALALSGSNGTWLQ